MNIEAKRDKICDKSSGPGRQGGGLNPPNPPLGYAPEHTSCTTAYTQSDNGADFLGT